jgi:uncharacterized membrane protein
VTFIEAMEGVAHGFEALGAVVLVVGFIGSASLAVAAWRRTRDGRTAVVTLRQSFGAVLLLALEVLVAADLILTVAVDPTVENVAVLGLIVLIRTVLSISLEIEIDGTLPWRRAQVREPARTAEDARRSGTAHKGPTPPS